MGEKRKLKSDSMQPAKHKYSLRSTSKCKQFEVENFFMRFPAICDKIFSQFDPQSFETCRTLSRFWHNQIDQSRIFWIRKIQFYTENYIQYKAEWKTVTKKVPIKVLKDLTIALKTFRPDVREDWKKSEACLKILKMDTDDQFSPLHIAAKFGFDLFKEISKKFCNKNPTNNNGETALHCAVKCGHLDVCQLIIENVEDKNPADHLGFTPLHYAAMLDNLEIYKLIVENVNLKNPAEKDYGISPFHCAHNLDKKRVHQFICDNFDFGKNNTKVQYNVFEEVKINLPYAKAREQNVLPLLNYRIAILEEMKTILSGKCTLDSILYLNHRLGIKKTNY